MIRTARPSERIPLVRLAVATGLFEAVQAEELLGGVLDDLFAERLSEGHYAHVVTDDETDLALGWVYFAPAFKADGVWDLWWIGVAPGSQARGFGTALLAHVESWASAAGGRLLIVETSSTPPLANARRFYALRGYQNCGTIPDYYGVGDDKTTFAKPLASR